MIHRLLPYLKTQYVKMDMKIIHAIASFSISTKAKMLTAEKNPITTSNKVFIDLEAPNITPNFTT